MTTFNDAQKNTKIMHAAEQLGVKLSSNMVGQLTAYLNALALWNKAFNLTAITDPELMLVKHVYDSLSVLPHLPLSCERLLDVGTGAGLPGLIIGICNPERSVVLLDSNAKKIRFLRQVVGELALDNVTPVHVRLKSDWADAALGEFDVVISRAFAALSDFVLLTQAYLAEQGSLYAMKGHVPTDEIAQLKPNWHIDTRQLHVPSLHEARSLVVLRHKCAS